MIRPFVFYLLICLSFFSCREEGELVNASMLRFSADTLLFDTVFSSVGSITKRFKVYNDEANPIIIPNLRLARSTDSPFDMVVNGVSGLAFNNLEILPGDSILVLVSVTIDPMDQDLPYIVTDSVVASSGSQTWDVDLVAWGQDAWFLSDSILSCNTVWTGDRPYVIYNSVLVDTLCTLTIDPGVRIYSHNGSTLFVKGSLIANGTPEKRILFRNDRLDGVFNQSAGQWEGIYFLEGSKGNQMVNTDIRNGIQGLRLGTPDDDSVPDLVLENVRIENMSGYGILSFTSDLEATNLLVNNCRLGGIAAVAGGNYSFKNCTVANFPINFLFDGPAMVLSDNVVLSNGQAIEEDLNVTLQNSVVWGLNQDELIINESGNTTVQITFEHNYIKSSISYNGINTVYNTDPQFVSPSEYNYTPDENSPLINAGMDIGVSFDLFGAPRSNPPDIGAVERDQ